MALTRRAFIRRTGLVAAGSLLGPGWMRRPFVQEALADTLGDRYFVVVFLDGGNDGLNTVVPIANGSSGALRTAYEAARKTGTGGLQLAAADLGATAIGADPQTGTPLALHPGLSGIKQLYDLGKVAVIQGCGYPNYSLSHDTSRKSWQTGLRSGNTGWVGRYLAASYTGADVPAVNIRPTVATEFVQSTTSVLAIRRLAQFSFPYDSYSATDMTAKRSAFLSLCSQAAADPQPTMSYTGNSGMATLLASESYPPLSRQYQNERAGFNAQYPSTGFARDLREVAKIIYGVSTGTSGVKARYFEVRNGGYDTHSDQGTNGANDQHNQLLHEVGDALEVFYSDCADMGVANRLGIVLWSEFSRRIQQNDNGTDHGSQGPMFVIGGAVNGGVYGNHPNINSGALNNDGNTVYSQAAGDPYRSTDLRDVYGTLLKQWLNMPQATILPSVLQIDGGDPNHYWTAPNFDLGFL
jgi:uncharacterized protein (DUF1501 family)